MTKLKVFLGVIGIGVLVWSIGILTGFWGNPIFSYFWIASNNLANNLSYLGLGVGAFVIALSVIIYYKNSKKEMETNFLNSRKSSGAVSKHNGNGLMVKLTDPLSLIGTVFLLWSIGIVTGFWGDPIFSYFWVAGNDLANNLSYLGLSVGAFLIVLAIIIYYKNTKTNKIFVVDHHLKQHREDFHYYLWEKNQQLIKDNNENYPTVLMNGRRSELGKEDMEKIVNSN
jgi:hypothetical protein